eukprot:CAMPEP_0176189742 /NCGR_PEP_ID=MMETSP0121_2-20121125/3584_1 /TAXON_ID=160619 /ORGANISM="Kryptoperidinium foliaceum, Strain CCMP 1326" /LENGTH=229 /DNA_ID=CAMNT_0017528351 /DNA_START=19 /DNA_END=706 /DNA_ORIENTATION=-
MREDIAKLWTTLFSSGGCAGKRGEPPLERGARASAAHARPASKVSKRAPISSTSSSPRCTDNSTGASPRAFVTRNVQAPSTALACGGLREEEAEHRRERGPDALVVEARRQVAQAKALHRGDAVGRALRHSHDDAAASREGRLKPELQLLELAGAPVQVRRLLDLDEALGPGGELLPPPQLARAVVPLIIEGLRELVAAVLVAVAVLDPIRRARGGVLHRIRHRRVEDP